MTKKTVSCQVGYLDGGGVIEEEAMGGNETGS